MTAAQSFFTYWPFHVPNYILAVLLYACIGRFILSLFVRPDWDNYIWKGFVWVSNPAVKVTAFITPNAVPPPLLVIFAILWLLALRAVLFIEMLRWGLAPSISG